MQLNKLYILSLICFVTLTACNNDKQEQKSLQDKVIHTHDELMVQMDELMQNKNNLKIILNKLDSLKKSDQNIDTVQLKDNIQNSIVSLDNADNEMMNWMHQFNPDYSGKKHEEVMEYLKNQEQKILQIQNLFKKTLLRSDSLINKYK